MKLVAVEARQGGDSSDLCGLFNSFILYKLNLMKAFWGVCDWFLVILCFYNITTDSAFPKILILGLPKLSFPFVLSQMPSHSF